MDQTLCLRYTFHEKSAAVLIKQTPNPDAHVRLGQMCPAEKGPCQIVGRGGGTSSRSPANPLVPYPVVTEAQPQTEPMLLLSRTPRLWRAGVGGY